MTLLDWPSHNSCQWRWEHNSIMEKNGDVGCYIWHISGMVFVNPVMLVRLRRKLLPDLEEDDLQGFPNKVWSSWHGVCCEKSWTHWRR
jgi:hypothetical protein